MDSSNNIEELQLSPEIPGTKCKALNLEDNITNQNMTNETNINTLTSGILNSKLDQLENGEITTEKLDEVENLSINDNVKQDSEHENNDAVSLSTNENKRNEDSSRIDTASDVETDICEINLENETDRTVILDFATRLQKYVKKQNKKIKKLKSKLKYYVSKPFIT